MYPSWILLRGGMALSASWTWCRRCGDTLPRNDAVGSAESVCRSCRKGR